MFLRRLFQRLSHRRHAHPPREGCYQRCVQLLADLKETENAFSAALQNPGGMLLVDLHGALALYFVLLVLDQFCQRYPDIELEIGMGERLIDLVRDVWRLDRAPVCARRLVVACVQRQG